MNDEKEFPIVKYNKYEIKLYEENKSIRNPPTVLELSIVKCPIACNNCKTVYSNKLTGIRIVCNCPCHLVVN